MNLLFPPIARLILLSFASLCKTAAHASDKPNIVFIFADDWGSGDLRCRTSIRQDSNYRPLGERWYGLSSIHRCQSRLLAQPDRRQDGVFSGSVKHIIALRVSAQQCEKQHARLAQPEGSAVPEVSSAGRLHDRSCRQMTCILGQNIT